MPKRVQVTWRKPGGKKPPNTIYEGRPGKYGNPYPVQEYGREECLKLFEEYLRNRLDAEPDLLKPLMGKDLACWCKPHEACHADILLEYANKIDT